MPLKIFEASRRLAALTAQFTAAGLDIEQFIAAADDTALKAHLETLKTVQADPATASALTAANSRVTVLVAGIEKFGATPKASDEKAGITAADIEASLRARASILACEQLAKHGYEAGQALPVTPSADVTKPAAKDKPALTGLAKVQAAFSAESAARAARRAV